MTTRTKAEMADIKRMIRRADDRFVGAEKAAHRIDTTQGEYDSNFEGVVAGINFVVAAHILATTGIRRKVDEASAPTLIASVISAIKSSDVPNVPSLQRLTNLNARRNASGHQGEWLDGIDTDALEDAVEAGRSILHAVEADLRQKGIAI